MWIKKTRVKTKSGDYQYVQLVHSISVKGRSRHKVIANLGRLDSLELSAVESLVKSISDTTDDSLEAEEIRLLPVQKYGLNMLLRTVSQRLGVFRFFTDLARYKKMNPDAVYSIFALLSYYTANADGSIPFFKWLKEYYSPQQETVSNAMVEQAFLLLADTFSLRDRLVDASDAERGKYHYTYLSPNSNLKGLSESAYVLATATEDFHLVLFKTLKEGYGEYDGFRDEDLQISDSLKTLEERRSFDCRKTSFICKVKKNELARLFQQWKAPEEFACSGGYFHTYQDIGYRSRKFEGKTLVVVRPSGGNAGNVTYRKFDPREMIVSAADLDPEKILEIYCYIEKLQNYYFNIFLPVDLDFLYQKMSPRRILYGALNLFFIKLLFMDYLEKKIAPMDLTVEDAIRECDGILTAQIFDGVTTRRFHSKLTGVQCGIFDCIGMRKHPFVSFREASAGVKKKK